MPYAIVADYLPRCLSPLLAAYAAYCYARARAEQMPPPPAAAAVFFSRKMMPPIMLLICCCATLLDARHYFAATLLRAAARCFDAADDTFSPVRYCTLSHTDAIHCYAITARELRAMPCSAAHALRWITDGALLMLRQLAAAALFTIFSPLLLLRLMPPILPLFAIFVYALITDCFTPPPRHCRL